MADWLHGHPGTGHRSRVPPASPGSPLASSPALGTALPHRGKPPSLRPRSRGPAAVSHRRPPHSDRAPSSATTDSPPASHRPRGRPRPPGTPGPSDGGKPDREPLHKTPRPQARRRGALGTPATPAACAGAPPAPGSLDAGRGPGLCERETAHPGPRVRGAPSVGGDPRGLGVALGGPCPPRPPCASLSLCIHT
jgi:hypothetical protein